LGWAYETLIQMEHAERLAWLAETQTLVAQTARPPS
jgi:hypothetical protein